MSRKKQKEVQKILNRPQPTLCYDISRIRKRIKFVTYLLSIYDIFFTFIQNAQTNFTDTEIKILTLMFYTSSFTHTSDMLKISQVRVRYTFDNCLEKMEKLQMWEIYEIFMSIRQNLNIIKRKYKDQE